MGQHTGPFDVVRLADPAVDDDAKIDWKTYWAERDPKLLVYFQGKQPAVFRCRPLSWTERRQVRALRDADGQETPESNILAFRMGLESIARWTHADGTLRDWHRPDDGSGQRKPIPDSAMEAAGFGDATLIDIGGVIEARSFLDRDQPLFCRLPATSQRVQTHQALLRAGWTSDTSPPSRSSSPPAVASTPPSTQPSSPPGDGSGDVTATASPTSTTPP